jgi:hypothetical protein
MTRLLVATEVIALAVVLTTLLDEHDDRTVLVVAIWISALLTCVALCNPA